MQRSLLNLSSAVFKQMSSKVVLLPHVQLQKLQGHFLLQ